MKTNFDRFRRFHRATCVLLVLALAGFVAVMSLVPQPIGAAIGVTYLIIVGIAMCVVAALGFDSLVCPKCGQRMVSEWRNREDGRRLRSIFRREPITCVHCGAVVETKEGAGGDGAQ